jgi:hypothetical protein
MRGRILFVVAVGVLYFCPDRGRAVTSAPQVAGIVPASTVQAAQSANASRNALRNAYFGDLHVHTSWSLDAFNGGNRLNGPEVAYRYGSGELVRGPNGSEQLRVPLDFMAVTDHDIWIAEGAMCTDPADAVYNTQICRDIRKGGVPQLTSRFYTQEFRHHPEICGEGDQRRCIERAADRWQQAQKNADAFYQPGKFTTFAAYEWTGAREVNNFGAHLHRNVYFRGAQIPVWGGSAVEMRHQPERLWAWLDRACTGPCQALVIPHNTNYSLGITLDTKNSDGTPFTRAILEQRAKVERLIEIHQIKGNSECGVGVGTTDEDCNFEPAFPACSPNSTTRCAFSSDYVRNALKNGLQVEAQYGVNPFKFGFIGSTDTHRSSGGATEESLGNASNGVIGDKPAPFPAQPPPPSTNPFAGRGGQNPGGLAGVWAEENTRESVFDALKRRETFATSGTRVRVRFFGGWTYPVTLHTRRTMIEDAYKSGVPMGADLPSRPRDVRAPRFVVWASRDPQSANLQKVQIVKGWTQGGQTFEKVYDVVCSDGLKADARSGRCPDNGATVNLADCSVSAGKGAPELSTTWTDSDFTASERAFYYVRVLENPTCRWAQRRALATNSKAPADEALIIQERAWSSPIWYTPRGQ